MALVAPWRFPQALPDFEAAPLCDTISDELLGLSAFRLQCATPELALKFFVAHPEFCFAVQSGQILAWCEPNDEAADFEDTTEIHVNRRQDIESIIAALRETFVLPFLCR
eukprot:TRINITY_DN12107_c0_g1_i1.p1 TRINITY_DN12107_c0_g1~~TRINITY_DN12107_c0_g1_i1.p1  ORF type:complete len:110 (+),score=15.48 TRINITY_DN12107_c0_g1_i1:355-684(+)